MKPVFRNIGIGIAITIALVSLFVGTAKAGRARRDTTVAAVIKGRLAANADKLNYPASVKRFYIREGFKPVWVLTNSNKIPAWDAILLLECVSQYGLSPADYRPQELNCGTLNALLAQKNGNNKCASFDIKLTDAIITLINNLHFGKLNPQFGHNRIDADNITEFKADYALADALEWNTVNDMVIDVQPQTEAYINLQRHMLLLTTKYSGPERAKPERDMRLVAINLERLRWMYTTGKPMHLTCTMREGVLIYGKDVNNEDAELGKRLYGK